MKTLTEYLTFHTRERRELVRITDTVAELVRKSGIQEGMVLVSAMHITAGPSSTGSGASGSSSR